MEKFLEKTRLALSRMIFPGDRIVTAVSGGPDSVALLHVLADVQQEFDFRLIVAHLNHMSRPGESEQDARFVKELGETLGLETYIEKIDVVLEKEKFKTSFQEAARILRYQFLLSTLKRTNATRLALGHNADDQVETILLNLMRGSGLKGLTGMPESTGVIIRPLIDCSRAEIEAYLETRGLESRMDSSNASPKYLRNRIRQELVPVLKSFNKNIASTLLETAKIIRDDDRCLDNEARLLFSQIAVHKSEGKGVELHREKFSQLSPAYQKRLVRQAIDSVQGNLRRISTGHVHQVLELFHNSLVGKKIDLPCQLMAVNNLNGVEIQRNSSHEKSQSFSKEEDFSFTTELLIPGETEIEKVGISLHAEILSLESWVDAFEKFPHRACFDFDKTGHGIKARFFRPGDRFVPLGMKGRKKLKSFFIDEKVPRESRELIPILTTRKDDIIWVYGKRIAEPFRVTEKTRKILFIEGNRDFQSFSP